MKKLYVILFLIINLLGTVSAFAQQSFEEWKKTFRKEALSQHVLPQTLNTYLPLMTENVKVVELDRGQPEFTLSFTNYMQRVVTEARIQKGREMFKKHNRILGRIEELYGVPAHYLVAFWGIETNYGATKGNFSTLNSLATLAYDHRRSSFFTEQLITLLKILEREGIDVPQGSWAGAFGHFQFMPTTFYQYAVDEDGDGRIDVVHSFSDALASAAHYLSKMGWTNEVSWGREVVLPPKMEITFEKKPISYWIKQGVVRKDGRHWKENEQEIQASLVLPEGVKGPAFLVYQNFDVIKRWNRSDFYAIAIGVLADKIIQKPTSDVSSFLTEGNLYKGEIIAAQEKLIQLGLYDSKPDGKLGRGTTAAVIAFQKQNGLPQDGYLSKELLEKILK